MTKTQPLTTTVTWGLIGSQELCVIQVKIVVQFRRCSHCLFFIYVTIPFPPAFFPFVLLYPKGESNFFHGTYLTNNYPKSINPCVCVWVCVSEWVSEEQCTVLHSAYVNCYVCNTHQGGCFDIFLCVFD